MASPKLRVSGPGRPRATGRFSKGAGDGDPEIHMGFLPQQASFALFLLVACWGDSLRIRNDKSIHVISRYGGTRMILFTNMSWLIFKIHVLVLI